MSARLSREDRAALCDALFTAAGVRLAPSDWTPVGGGSIHAAYRVAAAEGAFFLKLNEAAGVPFFEAEFDGLTALAATACVRVPQPVAVCATGAHACLLTEWIDLHPGGRAAGAMFGTQLARLHRCRGERFGWHRDNFLGSTGQPNGERRSWCHFFSECRLGFQLALAAKNGFAGALQDKGARLQERLPALLGDHDPAPALIHGDLWGGNWGVAQDGEPVMFDPAVHRADRECDLSMSALFGGFPAEFFTAYAHEWPLAEGHELRRKLYQLYHVLNHLNLFGATYLRQAESLQDTLLAQTGG